MIMYIDLLELKCCIPIVCVTFLHTTCNYCYSVAERVHNACLAQNWIHKLCILQITVGQGLPISQALSGQDVPHLNT
jgi:hypothetical protein